MEQLPGTSNFCMSGRGAGEAPEVMAAPENDKS
jgi:hypothetical protein